ncbi:MAG: hypothetical protein K8S97_07100 [Anaerolineae bacterium]|nr:hypothetical protein [Anaerolineae bacterium]
MRKTPRPVLLVILLLILSALACSIESTTVHIDNPRLYKEPSREASATRSFRPADTIYCIVDVKDMEDDPATVRIVWYQIVVDEDTADETEVEFARQSYIVTADQELIFPRTPPAHMPDQQWERGAYRLKLWINDDHDATFDFKVK